MGRPGVGAASCHYEKGWLAHLGGVNHVVVEAQFLAGNTQGKAHQLLYFTCQPHMAELLRKAEPQAALFHVKDGSIKAA